MALAVTIPDVLLQGCFPELREFVPLDARRLPEAVPSANGRDLLDLFQRQRTRSCSTIGVLRHGGLIRGVSSTGTPTPRNTKGFRNHDGSSTPDTDDDYAFDFTLSPASTRPQVTADRAQDFGCQWVSVLGLRELMLGGVLAWSSIVETIIARGGVRA